MTLKEFIERELKLAQTAKPLNTVTARFVQLHEQAERSHAERAEYSALCRIMRTRWRWHQATLDARQALSERDSVIDSDHN